MMIRRRAPRRRGLSLIEVLLALAILLLSIIAIGRLVDIGTDHSNQARSFTRGARLAQSKMAEVEAGVVPLTGEASGAFEGDDAAWTYTVTPEASGPPNLYTVTVTVSRTIEGKPFELTLTQMIFDPTLTGSAAQAERPPAEEPTEDTTGGTSP